MAIDEKEMAGRVFPVAGCENFRELGGYPAGNGKKVKHGIFYRTGALAPLAGREKELEQLGLRSVLDLRSKMERDEEPDPIVPGARYYPISALKAMDEQDVSFDLSALASQGAAFLKTAADFVEEGYHQMPFDNEAYRALFHLLQNGETPLLFHCTAGKDRTGVAAALILLALGASEETVMEDYLYTNVCRKNAALDMAEKYGSMLVKAQPEANPAEVFRLIAGVQKSSLQAALDEILKRYGSYEKYFLKEYGLDEAALAALRGKYLEDA